MKNSNNILRNKKYKWVIKKKKKKSYRCRFWHLQLGFSWSFHSYNRLVSETGNGADVLVRHVAQRELWSRYQQLSCVNMTVISSNRSIKRISLTVFVLCELFELGGARLYQVIQGSLCSVQVHQLSPQGASLLSPTGPASKYISHSKEPQTMIPIEEFPSQKAKPTSHPVKF